MDNFIIYVVYIPVIITMLISFKFSKNIHISFLTGFVMYLGELFYISNTAFKFNAMIEESLVDNLEKTGHISYLDFLKFNFNDSLLMPVFLLIAYILMLLYRNKTKGTSND